MSKPKDEDQSAALGRAALDYHRAPPPGKLSVTATKPLENQRDLALAYLPGVAAACVSVRSGRGMGAVKRISHVEAKPHKVLSFCW